MSVRSAPITPMPVPAGARGVLLFGGTFDPPHRAHVELPRSVRDRLCGRGWWLVYVPAARNPLKPAGAIASDAQRVEMLRLATRGVSRCAIWTDELDRARLESHRRGPPRGSFWIDTMERAARAIRQAAPGATLRFLIGSDQAAAFHQWRSAREILALAEPIVMLRPPHTSALAVRRALARSGFWTRAERETWAAAIDDATTMPHAATSVREALARGDASAARGLVARPVLAFASREGIYARSGAPVSTPHAVRSHAR